MTIDELNALTTLTANDEVPVWDKEASGEPTRKITASNLAASVKSLASLPNTTEMNDAIAQSTAKFALTGNIGNIPGNQTIESLKSINKSGITNVYMADQGIDGWGLVCSYVEGNAKTIIVLCSANRLYMHTDDGNTWSTSIV